MDGNEYDFDTPVTEDITLYAKWDPIVTFAPGNGEENWEVKVPCGSAVEKPEKDPVKSGYTFQGWQLNGEDYDFDTPVTEAITLTAAWKKNSSGGGGVTAYTLTYESNGGTAYPQETYVANRTVVLDKTPLREGYTFTGWFSDAALTEQVTSVKMNRNMTVYAGWEETTPELNTEDHFAYIIGNDEGLICPDDPITRAEVATIFFRMLTDESRDAIWSTTNPFPDVTTEDWFNNAISTMTRGGILKGYTDGTFRPDLPITRRPSRL